MKLRTFLLNFYFALGFIAFFGSKPLQAQPNLKKLESSLEKARIDWGVTGMSVAIVKDNQVVMSRGFGQLTQGKSTPVDEHSLFAIASNTKAFVSSALAKLVAEGKINWDDKVIDYLPYFRLYDPYVTQEATIRDLLSHRIGLGTFSGDVIWYKSVFSPEEVIKRAQYVPQAYPFRSGYGYSNLMFIAAGEVIRAVTEQAWDDYLAASFFEPLGMNRTITTVDELASKGNYATPHKPEGNQDIPIEWTRWDNMGAAGGIISSAADMAKWIQLNLNKGIIGKDTLLSPAQQNILWTLHNNFVLTDKARIWIPGRNFNGYGLGWGLYDYHGRMVVTHSGGYDGMYSRVVLVPAENLGFVILTNSMTGIINPLVFDIMNHFIKADTRDWSASFLNNSGGESIDTMSKIKIAARKKDTQPSFALKDYTGIFFDPMHGKIFVNLKDENLTLSFENALELNARLSHWHDDIWEIKWDKTHAWFDFGTVQFTVDNNRKITGLEFDVPNYDIFFDELHPKKVK